MKTAILTDTHFGARNDNIAFAGYFSKFYENIFFPYLKKHNIKNLIHMGDVFDRRKFVNYKTLYDARSMFFDPLAEEDIECHMLAGNHDTFYKTTNEVNSPGLLLKEYSNITTYNSPCELTNCNSTFIMMPWICKENHDSAVNLINGTKCDLMFGHLEVNGFEMIRGQFCIEGLERKLFDKFDMVFSGHFHHRSDNGTIYYVGNPYQNTWMDYKDPRGFHIFDFETRELTFIVNPYEMFHKYFYNDLDWTTETVHEENFDKWKNCYIKIIVENKTNPYLFDVILDKMYKSGVGDINVVESFAELDNDVTFVDEAQDTMTILSSYIDQMDTIANKKRLDILMRNLYNESLTLE
jgi:DNA repair exonuclease SbcCD nuclease subunit|tara:strand:- start:98 stop:1153 length:1056 start_codon:yes stop_codon:yes gene_type:complete